MPSPARKRGRGSSTPKANTIVFTSNIGGFGSFRDCLGLYAEASLIFIQEHHLVEERISSAAQVLAKAGWHSFWAPARPTVGRGSSAGVAVLAKGHLDVQSLGKLPSTAGFENASLVEHRIARALWRHRLFGDIVLYSIYLVVGLGAKGENATIMEALWDDTESHGLPFLIGGDFNMSPEALQPLLGQSAVVVHGGPSTRGPFGGACLDYFLASCEVAALTQGACPVEHIPTSPHQPIKLELLQGVLADVVTVARQYPSIPTSRVFGPIGPQREWQPLLAKAEALNREARLPTEGFQDKLNDLFADWAKGASHEIANITGSSFRVLGFPPQLKKVALASLFHGRGAARKVPSRAFLWLANRVAEFASYLGHRVGAPSNQALAYRLGLLTSSIDGCKTPFQAHLDIEGATAATTLLGTTARLALHALVHPSAASSVRPVLGSLAAGLRQVVKQATLGEWKHRSSEWRLAAQRDCQAGGPLLHKLAKGSQGWRQQLVPLPGGLGQTTRPKHVVAQLRETWGSLWAGPATELHHHDRAPAVARRVDAAALPDPLSVDTLRQTSKSFKERTCRQDGWHPRHFRLLPDLCLQGLASIFAICEEWGAWPSSLRQLAVAFYPKASGGVRPIGFYGSVFRLWSKARSACWRAWEQALPDSSCWALGKHRSIEQAVWHQAALCEGAAAKGEHAATILWDLTKAYEHVQHNLLWTLGVRFGAPLAVLRLALDSYTWPRVVQWLGFLADPVTPARGIVAGSSSATFEIKLALLGAAAHALQEHPSVGLGIYVDDISLTTQGKESDKVADIIAAGAADLADYIEVGLGLPLAQHKARTIASSASLARLVKARIPRLAGAIVATAPNLGIDYGGGKTAKTAKFGPKFKERFQRGRDRGRRFARQPLRKLQKARLVQAGGVAAFRHGLGVSGMLPSTLKKARDWISRTSGLRLKGGSTDIALAMHPQHDILHFACLPLLVLAKLWWDWAGTSRTLCPEARRLAADFYYIHDELRRARAAGGRLPWQKVRGPIGAAILWVWHIGWAFEGPATLVTNLGVHLSFLWGPPVVLSKLFTDALREKGLRELGQISNGTADYIDFRRRGPRPDILQQPLKSKTQLHEPPLHAHLRAAIIQGTVPTRVWYAARGFEVGAVCPHCPTKDDDIYHRLWECGLAAEARYSLPVGLKLRARLAGRGDPTYTRGWAPWPEGVSLSPATSLSQGLDAEGFWPTSDPLFSDGSCYNNSDLVFTRAGWAVVQFSLQSGLQVAAIWGTLPPEIVQSAANAELYAYLQASFNSRVPLHLYSDCMAVVSGAGALHLQRLRDRPGEALWRTARGAVPPDRVFHVKAHRDITTIADETLRRIAQGNERADELARAGAELHPNIPERHVGVARVAADAKLIQKFGPAVLASWPRPTEDIGTHLSRLSTSRVGTAETKARHEPYSAFGLWWCRLCSASSKCQAAFAKSPCSGVGEFWSQVALCTSKGHTLAHFAVQPGPKRLVVCVKCARYACEKWVALLQPCTSDHSSGHRGPLRRLARGLHPKQGSAWAAVLLGPASSLQS